MKKALSIMFLAVVSIVCLAQNVGAPKFLGIPIDGTKSQFVTKLKSKGFIYSSFDDCYKGQFNGQDVRVYVHTNHSVVDRVYVAFPYRSEEDVKIEYNILLQQFHSNGKYLDLSFNERIPDDEDISYEINVKNKRYQASFCYFDPDRDVVGFAKELTGKLSDYFTEEQAEKFIECTRKLASDSSADKSDIVEQFTKAMFQSDTADSTVEQQNEELYYKFMVDFLNAFRELADGDVWFMIHEHYGKCNIGLYYDNLHNRANGEDL